jgi:hypothetical protein
MGAGPKPATDNLPAKRNKPKARAAVQADLLALLAGLRVSPTI